MRVQSWTYVRSSVHFRVCHKTQTHPAPVPSGVPAPRKHIPGITQGLGFLRQAQDKSWGIPPARAYGLAACSHRWESRWRLTPFRVPIFCDLRSALYAASLASSGYHVRAYYVAEWGRFPFGPAYQPL